MSQQSDDVTIALLEHERASPNIRLSWAFPAPGELNANVLGARVRGTCACADDVGACEEVGALWGIHAEA